MTYKSGGRGGVNGLAAISMKLYRLEEQPKIVEYFLFAATQIQGMK